jgi:CheY-like chemotaxis protein
MAVPVNQLTFAHHVEDALLHLFDHFYLQSHPLSGLLAAEAAPSVRGRTLSRILIDAIDRLRPEPDVPPTSLAWRKYRYLHLRYVEALAPEQISRQLGISDRQGRRDHHQGLEALSTLLWDQYQALGGTPAPAPLEPADSAADIEDELLRIGSVAPRTACHLMDVLDGALATLGPLVERAGCRVAVDVPPDLPPAAINPLILRQVLIGLLTRAIDLRKAGDVRLVAAERPTGNVLTISARGAPVEADDERLSTSRRLADMQGARLSVPADLAEGMVHFVLELPVVERATVLVIDDNPDVVLLFRRYLGQSYRLLQATTADEALELARQTRPALITLDVMMPGVDGWQTLDSLRRDPATSPIPVVVCSILREPSLATALGAVAYLPKPVNPLALRAVLDQCLAEPKSAGPGSP